MIFWLVLKLEISYRVMISLEGFWLFFTGFFLRLYFMHGEIFEFPSLFFCPKILCNVNGKATHCDTPLVLLVH